MSHSVNSQSDQIYCFRSFALDGFNHRGSTMMVWCMYHFEIFVQILALKGRETSELINLNKETEGSCSNRSENSSEVNLDISRTPPAIESPNLNNPHQGIPFFPSIIKPPSGTTMVQLLQGPNRPDLQSPKIEHNGGVHDENLSNLLCGMDDQSAFWPWSDHNNFH